jgi:hypothetical protein
MRDSREKSFISVTHQGEKMKMKFLGINAPDAAAHQVAELDFILLRLQATHHILLSSCHNTDNMSKV